MPRPPTYPGGAEVVVLPSANATVRPTTLDCAAISSCCLHPRTGTARLSDLCRAFVEKTSCISRRIRTRLATWRTAVPQTCPYDCPVRQRAMQQQQQAAYYRQHLQQQQQQQHYVQPLTSRQQRDMLRSYGMNYEQSERYEELASRRPTTNSYSRDIIRSLEELELSRIPPLHHQSYQHIRPEAACYPPYNTQFSSSWCSERPYATLPSKRDARRASASVNIEDRFLPKDLQRLSRYPKSLQDLKYLEIEAILERDPLPTWTTHGSRSRRQAHRSALDVRQPRSLSTGSRPVSSLLDRQNSWLVQANDSRGDFVAAGPSQIDRLEPGKVHYEREYRIYGKDTVALIFYKTCYL
ncbi:hypothetical protein TKK_0019639 [Trichogramma kaykai]